MKFIKAGGLSIVFNVNTKKEQLTIAICSLHIFLNISYFERFHGVAIQTRILMNEDKMTLLIWKLARLRRAHFFLPHVLYNTTYKYKYVCTMCKRSTACDGVRGVRVRQKSNGEAPVRSPSYSPYKADKLYRVLIYIPHSWCVTNAFQFFKRAIISSARRSFLSRPVPWPHPAHVHWLSFSMGTGRSQ